MFERARAFRTEHMRDVSNRNELTEFFSPESDEYESKAGGFAVGFYDGTPDEEDELKADLGATVRCIPIDQEEGQGECVVTGRPAVRKAVFAKAY